MFTFKQLRYFVSVAEQGSVTAAADHLFVSQPGISAAITQLEELLDAQLLIRHKAKGVELTPAGRSMLVMARELLRHADDVLATGRGLSHSLEGSLHIGFFHTIGPHIVPSLLAAFRRRYPQVQVSILEGDLAQLQEALRSGDIEIAVTYDIGADEHMAFTRLQTLRPYVVAAADSAIAQGSRVFLRRLENEAMVLLDLPHSREYFYAIFRKAGVVPCIGYRTKSVPMVRSLVANGLGYSILNFRPARRSDYDGKLLAYVDIEDTDHSLEVVLSWRKGVRLTERARAFIEVAQKHLGSNIPESNDQPL
jgi:DNA-binding transcriptional LysR family regulator